MPDHKRLTTTKKIIQIQKRRSIMNIKKEKEKTLKMNYYLFLHLLFLHFSFQKEKKKKETSFLLNNKALMTITTEKLSVGSNSSSTEIEKCFPVH